jgi:hypothetical protein
MEKVICDECSKILFETWKTSKVSIGIEAQQKGFIYKNACLFSTKYSSLIFCSEECKKVFYQKNIPKTEQNIKIQEVLEDMKKDIPKMAKECCEGLDQISKFLKQK